MRHVIGWAIKPALTCLALAASGVQADMARECQPRALTAAEKEAAELVVERLRKAMPAAPAGWTIRDERTDVATGSCPEEGGTKPIAQPVNVSVLRNFVRKDAPPQAAPAPPPAPAASSVTPDQIARAEALEKEINELKARETRIGMAYREARRAGDSDAQREANEASRKLRAEMAPLQKELQELRRLMREERAAAGAASTRAAQARMEEARANRRDASVSVHTNPSQVQVRGARPVQLSGVPLAFRDGSGAMYLLLGGWQRSGAFAVARIDESAPTTRVQSLRVRIDGNEAVTEQLLEALNVNAVAQLVDGAHPAPAQSFRTTGQAATAPVEIALRLGIKDYRFSGQAECKAAAQASIHGISAALYSVAQRSSDQSLNFTLWQPKDGSPAMVSLHVSLGASRYEIDTVKGGAKRDTKGSVTAALQKAGAGGVFTINAKAANGEPVSGKIQCGRFGSIQAEGG